MSDTVLEIAAVPRLVRLRAMGRLGVRMMFHDRLKFIGTISGVVFAVLLAVQQLSILFALLNRNTQFVDNAGADIFIVPPNTRLLQPGEKLHESVLYQARSTAGVLEAQPLVFAAATLAKPDGGSESVTLIGFEHSEHVPAGGSLEHRGWRPPQPRAAGHHLPRGLAAREVRRRERGQHA